MTPTPLEARVPEAFGYEADVVRVIDGDTVVLDIDLGWHTYLRKSARFYGINAPEHDTQAGQDSKAYLKGILLDGVTKVLVRSHGDDKYGRTLVEVYLPDPSGGAANVNMMLKDSGHAFTYFGEGKKPVA